MRKPDPPPSTSTSKRGSSASEAAASRKSMADMPAIAPSLGSGDTAASQPQFVAGVKRKKSRVYVPIDEEEESEGAQADAEYGGLRADSSSGWVNDSRRRSVAHHASTSRRIDTGDELRRHSMAV